MATTTMMATAKAMELVCARNIHRCFWLPENEAHGRLRVTYAVTSNFDKVDLPVALFCGPPGMGGSTRVPLRIRMQVWLEMVPALLRHTGVEHISLMCHSAGTPYALNTLYHLRDLLDPKAPYIGIMGPWVHNEHSQVSIWKWAGRLPNGMLDSWNGILKFIGTWVNPSLLSSGAAITSVSNRFRATPVDGDDTEDDLAKLIGTSTQIATEMQRLYRRFCFAEDTTAINDDTRLCLKKGGTGMWGACEDYEEYVGKVVANEKQRREAFQDQPKLKVRVFYAESDIMIGRRGQAYFERCWSQPDVAQCVDYDSAERPGTTHDTVFVSAEKGALKTIFQDIGDRYGDQ